MQTIGMIGIGQMGAPMARNLLKGGYPVNVYDINEKQMELLAQAGAKKSTDAKDLAAQSDVVITVLTWPHVVEEVILGPKGVVEGLKRGAVAIECSSIDHETSLRLGQKVEAAGGRFMEAALMGRPNTIESKELDILTAGRKETVQKCEPVLNTIARKALYVGELGAAKLLKIASAMLNATETAVTYEVLTWCLHNGISQEGFLEIVKHRRPRSADGLAEILKGRYDTSPSWVAKDLYHGVKIAGAKEVPTPILSTVNAITNLAKLQNKEGYRFSEMLWKYYESTLKTPRKSDD